VENITFKTEILVWDLTKEAMKSFNLTFSVVSENVRLKKVNTRHILKSTLSARPPREPLTARQRYARRRTSSLPDLHAAATAAAAAPGSGGVQPAEVGRFRLRPARLARDDLSDPSYLHTLPSVSASLQIMTAADKESTLTVILRFA